MLSHSTPITSYITNHIQRSISHLNSRNSSELVEQRVQYSKISHQSHQFAFRMVHSNSHSSSSSRREGPASRVIAVRESSNITPKPSRFTPSGTPEGSSDESSAVLSSKPKPVKKKAVPEKKPEGKEKGYDADTEKETKYKLFIEKKESGKDKVAQVYQRADGLLATEKRKR